MSNESSGATWLDTLLKALGLRDVDAAELVSAMYPADPLNPSMVNKWRHGKSVPSLPRLRVLIKAIQPRAKQFALTVRPMDAYLAFGHLEPADLDLEETPQVYQESIAIDRQLPDEPRERMRATVSMVNTAMRAELPRATPPPRRRRSAS